MWSHCGMTDHQMTSISKAKMNVLMFELTELNKEHAADALTISLVPGQNQFSREDNKTKRIWPQSSVMQRDRDTLNYFNESAHNFLFKGKHRYRIIFHSKENE